MKELPENGYYDLQIDRTDLHQSALKAIIRRPANPGLEHECGAKLELARGKITVSCEGLTIGELKPVDADLIGPMLADGPAVVNALIIGLDNGLNVLLDLRLPAQAEA